MKLIADFGFRIIRSDELRIFPLLVGVRRIGIDYDYDYEHEHEHDSKN